MFFPLFRSLKKTPIFICKNRGLYRGNFSRCFGSLAIPIAIYDCRTHGFALVPYTGYMALNNLLCLGVPSFQIVCLFQILVFCDAKVIKQNLSTIIIADKSNGSIARRKTGVYGFIIQNQVIINIDIRGWTWG